MSGRVYVSRSYGWAPVVPGKPLRTVTRNGQKDVTRRYEYPNPRAGTQNRSQSVTSEEAEDPGYGPAQLLLAFIVAFDWVVCALIIWVTR